MSGTAAQPSHERKQRTMGELVGGLVEGLVTGIKDAFDRNRLADEFEAVAGKIRRGDLVSDEALDKANKTLQRMRDAREAYQDD